MKFSAFLLSCAVSAQYIVKLKAEQLSKRDAGKLDLSWAKEILARHNPDSLVEATSPIYSEYNFNGFKAFAVDASEDAIRELKNHERVEYVSFDGKLKLYAPVTEDAVLPSASTSVWGLDRINQRSLPLDSQYSTEGNGTGVTVYVVDTGIKADHPEFEGRAISGPGWINRGSTVSTSPDTQGHGTHCAGTIGSKTYGVAKNATIVGIKVFGSDVGYNSDLILALQHITKVAVPGKTVISMSLGADLSSCQDVPNKPDVEDCNSIALKDAVKAVVAANIAVVVAAGNDSTDACRGAPASELSAYTVASSTRSDALSSFSNYGPCVDIIAPGSSIKSTWYNGGTNTISGTSMATPHVAGAFAVLLSKNNFGSTQEAYNAMTALSTKGKISGVPSSTLNNLLFVQ